MSQCSTKIPFGDISDSKNSFQKKYIQQKFRLAKIPFGENSVGENSFGENSGHGYGRRPCHLLA